MVLVVDCTKGIQTQTAECLVIGQIVCSSMLVVLNKTDLLPKEKSATMLEKMTKKLKLTFQKTKFKEVEIVPVSAKPGGPDSSSHPEGLEGLVSAIQRHSYVPSRCILVGLVAILSQLNKPITLTFTIKQTNRSQGERWRCFAFRRSLLLNQGSGHCDDGNRVAGSYY